MRSLSSVLSYNHLKEKLGLFLTGYTVAKVTCYVGKIPKTCSKMSWNVFDTIIIVSSDKEWFNINLSKYKSCKVMETSARHLVLKFWGVISVLALISFGTTTLWPIASYTNLSPEVTIFTKLLTWPKSQFP